MSGYSASEYTVNPEVYAARALARVQVEVDGLLAQRRNLCTEIAAFNHEFAPVGVAVAPNRLPDEKRPTTLADCEAYAAQLRQAMTSLRQMLGTERERASRHLTLLREEQATLATAQRQRVWQVISQALAGWGPAEAPTQAVEDRLATNMQADQQQESTAPAVWERLLQRLPEDLDSGMLREIEALAEQLIAAKSHNRAALLEGDLRRKVQRAIGVSRSRDAAAEEAGGILARLRPFGGPDVAQVAQELVDVVEHRGPLTADLRTRADRAYRLARKHADHDYTQRAIQEVLTDMGYEVAEEFVVVEPHRGTGSAAVAHVKRSDWGDFEVCIECDEEKAGLKCEVIYAGEAGGSPGELLRDAKRIEQEWCSTLDPLLAKLSERGVGCKEVRRSELGMGEVPVRQRASRRRRQKKAQARARQTEL